MVKGSSAASVGVEVGKTGVAGHVGLWALGLLADRLGLGGSLSKAFGAAGAGVVHDRGGVWFTQC